MDLSNLKNNEKIIKRKNDYFKGKAESKKNLKKLNDRLYVSVDLE